MDIQSSNAFKGNVVEDSFCHGKCYDRPHNYPKLENKQVLNLPPSPHKRINTIYDRTHYHNDMQFGDGSDWTTFPVMKLTKFGWVCDYDGSAMYGDCGNNASLNITDAITIEARVKWDGTGDSVQGIVEKMQNYGFRTQTSDGQLRFRYYLGGSWRSDDSGYALPSGVWTHIVVVFSPPTADNITRFYANGTEVGTDIPKGTLDIIVDSLKIGSTNGLAEYFNGTIDEVMIYNRSQSAAKQKDNFWRYN